MLPQPERDSSVPVLILLPVAEPDEPEVILIQRDRSNDHRFLLDPLTPRSSDAEASRCARTVYDDIDTGLPSIATDLGFTYWSASQPKRGKYVVVQWELPRTDQRNRRLLARFPRAALADEKSRTAVGDSIVRGSVAEGLPLDREYVNECMEHIQGALERRENQTSRRWRRWKSGR
jgi:hypothetical protein